MFAVLNKRAYRLVHCRAENRHAVIHAKGIAVHVPTGVGDCDKSAARFAQTTGHHHLLAQCLGRKTGDGLAVLFLLRQTFGNLDVTGIVTLHPTRVFIGKIKYFRHAAEDNVERLLFKLAGALHTALVGEAFQLIKLIEQATPILESAAGQVQLHIIENVATLARVKRRVCLWQIANAGNAARYGT